MRDEVRLIQNKDGKFELYEPYATVDYMTEEDYKFVEAAVQKQTPQRPAKPGRYSVCPSCNRFVFQHERTHGNLDIPFCKWCGQALDWSEHVQRDCDTCVYNPPSSLDGKPCTQCGDNFLCWREMESEVQGG